jgi:hypothetical protein
MRPLDVLSLGIAGAGAGFLSGLTDVGGGVFLTPLIIAFGWMSPTRVAAFALPFILGNSVFGSAAVIVSRQSISTDAPLLAIGALTGAIVGAHIGCRYLSDVGTRRDSPSARPRRSPPPALSAIADAAFFFGAFCSPRFGLGAKSADDGGPQTAKNTGSSGRSWSRPRTAEVGR